MQWSYLFISLDYLIQIVKEVSRVWCSVKRVKMMVAARLNPSIPASDAPSKETLEKAIFLEAQRQVESGCNG